ncbi:MAG: glycosyltransferase, partial [Candidatus Marinimicrobia bacterium]|nr:glycosyltransferase [Candidatus Neomarinimicrobiota bacterium]
MAKEYEVHMLIAWNDIINDEILPFHTIPKARSIINRFTILQWKFFRKTLKINAEIYHLHDPELLLLGYVLKFFGKKVIFDLHEDTVSQIMFKRWIPLLLRKVISAIYAFILTVAGRFFDHIVCATDEIRLKNFQGKEKVSVIKNYAICGELSGENQLPFESRDCLSYVGGLALNRGLKEMITVAEALNIPLHLAGPFQHESEKKFVMSLSGWKHVVYHGMIDREEIKQLLSHTLLGLVLLHPLPYFIPSLPIKIFEYMDAGVPILASDFPIWKEIVEGNQVGVTVEATNITLIIEAVKKLLGDVHRLKK